MKNKNQEDKSRRDFIKNTSIAATGFFIVPRHVLGRGYVAPSDKLRIAGIGVGGKGQSDLSEFAKSPKASIVALCDVDDRSAAKSRTNFPNAKYYKDFREMLDKEKNNIDACSISTKITPPSQLPISSSAPSSSGRSGSKPPSIHETFTVPLPSLRG